MSEKPRKSRKLKVVKDEKPSFDPKASYTWKAEDQFAISGLELDILNKAFNAVLNDPQTQRALMAVEGAKVIGSIIRESIQEGIITPAPVAEAAPVAE